MTIYFCDTYDEKRTPVKEVDEYSLDFEDFVNQSYKLERIDVGLTNFYADLDLTVDLGREEFDARRAEAISGFSKLSGFVFTDGSFWTPEKKKLSFHIHSRHFQIYKNSFTWDSTYGAEIKRRLFVHFSPKMEEFFAKGLDNAVYGAHRWMRTPYSKLDNKPYPHIPQVLAPIEDYLITALPDRHNVEPAMKELARTKAAAKIEAIVHIQNDEESEEAVADPERAARMIEMLGKVKTARFRDYPEWFKLLCLMRGNGLPEAMFVRISAESGYENFSENECRKAWWRHDEKRSCGFPTLHSWLEADGVDWKSLFCKKKDKMISDLLEVFREAGQLTDLRVAEVFQEHYGDSLYLTPVGWLHYSSRGWEMGDEESVAYPLMKCVGERFIQYAHGLEKEDPIKPALKKQAARLCSYSAARAIIKTAACLFRNDTILKEFDRFPTWFSFSNGKAVDMRTGEIVELKKEHKVLTTCGYPLPDRHEAEIDDARAILRSITGEENWKSYTSMLAYQFQAGNPQQVVFVQTGSGGNGKSIVGNMMRAALGLYGGLLPIEQLTQNASGRDTANSALAAMRGKRYAQLNEPEDDSGQLTLKVARLKELSGEPEIKVRELHAKAHDMRIDFTMSILCNDIPKLSKNDGGVERRIKVVTYPYQFVEEPEEDHHRKRDERVKIRSESDPSLHRGFFWLMMDTFRATDGKFLTSDAIKQGSAEYLKENNPLAEWAGEYQPSEDFIRQKELYAEYIEWAGLNHKEKIAPRKFVELLRQLGIKMTVDSSHGNKYYVSK